MQHMPHAGKHVIVRWGVEECMLGGGVLRGNACQLGDSESGLLGRATY